MGKVAQGIRIQDRASTLSLPIATTALIRGATRIADDVASRVGQAIGFDDVLRGADGGLGDGHDVASLTDQLVKAIRTRLNQSGVAANHPLQLSVTEGGGLRVEGSHPQAAEIEAMLRSDPQLIETASKLFQASGGSENTIGLTIPSVLTFPRVLTFPSVGGNILQHPEDMRIG